MKEAYTNPFLFGYKKRPQRTTGEWGCGQKEAYSTTLLVVFIVIATILWLVSTLVEDLSYGILVVPSNHKLVPPQDNFGERVLADERLVCWCRGAPATKNVVKIAFERLWDFTTFGDICP